MLIGLGMHSLGHTGLWMVATGRITLAYWQVSTFALLGCQYYTCLWHRCCHAVCYASLL